MKDVSGRISYSTDIISTVKQTDLVLEAIVEKMAAKHELFSKIDSVSVFYLG